MFYVGQKVVCVDASEMLNDGGFRRDAPMLSEGSIYTVIATRSVGPFHGVQVAEVRPSEEHLWGFLASRFRPIVERKTDISIFTDMLTPKTEEVSA